MFKSNKKLNILILVLSTIPLFLSGFAAYQIMSHPLDSYADKVNKFTLLGLVFIIILFVIFLVFYLLKKRILVIVILILNLILSSAFLFGSFYYTNARDVLKNVTSNVESFTFYVIVKKGSSIQSIEQIDNKVVGMLSPALIDENHNPLEVMKNDPENPVNTDLLITEPFLNAIDGIRLLVQDQSIDAMIINQAGIEQIESISPELLDEIETLIDYTYTREMKDNQSQIDVSQEPFTVLIAGVDDRIWDTENNKANNKVLGSNTRTDSMMLATFNPATMRLLLTSIPRDTYLPSPCLGWARDKITHANYFGGIDCTIESLESALSIEIDNFVILNYQALVQLTDLVDGIDVFNPYEFCELDSNDIAYGSVCVDSGYQHLNGEQALAMSRHRKTLPTGDIQRGKNQMTVLIALIESLAKNSSKLSLNKILSVSEGNFRTNFTEQQMSQFYRLVQTMAGDSLFSSTSGLLIEKNAIETTGSTSSDGLSIQIAYQESLDYAYNCIQEILGNIQPSTPKELLFNPNIIQELKTRPSNIASYTPSYIPESPYTPPKFPDFNGQNLQAVQDWCWTINSEFKNAEVTCQFVNLQGQSTTKANARFNSATMRTGSQITASSTITFTFEEIEEPIDLPNMIGTTLSYARDWCTQNGISCQFLENNQAATNDQAKITGSNIAPGPISKNTVITFTVTSEIAKHTPTGVSSVAQAQNWCASNGIYCAFTNTVGTPISQPADLAIHALSTAFAPGETATFIISDVTVPNFNGMVISTVASNCFALTCLIDGHDKTNIVTSYSPVNVAPAYSTITFTSEPPKNETP